MFHTRPNGTALAERPRPEVADAFDDDFAFDVQVIVSTDRQGLSWCPTDDGCGNTCQGNDSSCNSFVDDPA